MVRDGAGTELIGRQDECKVLDDLLAQARAGRSGVLVVRGEAGIGKTELLNHLLDGATGCRVVRAVGVQSEMELSYAGLHQLCAPLLSHLESLPSRSATPCARLSECRSGTLPTDSWSAWPR